MMRGRIILLYIFVMMVCPLSGTEIIIRIDNCQGERIHFTSYFHDTTFVLERTGYAKFDLNLKEPLFAEIGIGKSKQLIYLEPTKRVEIYLSKQQEKVSGIDLCRLNWKSAGGELGAENTFLHTVKYTYASYKDLLPENAIASLNNYENILKTNYAKLENKGLSPLFKKMEGLRLKYIFYSRLVKECHAYPDFRDMLQVMNVDKASLLPLKEYRDFIEGIVKILASSMGERGDLLMLIKNEVKVIETYFHSSQVVEYLLNFYIPPYIEQNGFAGVEDLKQVYLKHVTNEGMLRHFKKICSIYEALEKGRPCPYFAFKDLSGNVVSLKDLHGKYVYIDMWATWCGPCKYEFPFLRELESKLQGKDIYFVGLSIDRNRDIDKWKQMVREENLPGLQLHLGEDWEWIKHFMPQSLSVPRFVLLDREGCFVNANMMRPSDPRILDVLLDMLNH